MNTNVNMDNDDKAATTHEHTAPLKDAASLIHTLDQAYADMNAQAANAARDAQEARKNARAASEIARRYLNRSYPSSSESPFGASAGATSTETGRGEGPTSASATLLSPSAILMTSPSAAHTNTPKHPHRSPPPPPPPRPSTLSTETPRGQTTTSNSEATIAPSSTTSSSGRRRPRFNAGTSGISTPSSERLAQSHADDVLELSLELERTKQALRQEQRQHDDTKAKIITAEAKASNLEETIQQLKKELEQERLNAKSVAEKFEQDLAQANYRADAADEDAEFALQLAKESAEARNKLEVELYQVKQELARSTYPNNTAGGTPSEYQSLENKRLVRFADQAPEASSPLGAPPPPQTPRPQPPANMVASGRLLLRRSLNKKYHDNDGEDADSSMILELERTPSKSAERRRKLREQLKELDEHDIVIPTPPRPPPPPPPPKGFNSVFNAKVLEECATVLRSSGHRLDLGGHWFRDGKENSNSPNVSPEKAFHNLEAMTRQYCQSVEFKVERQQKEVEELSSLCGFLEQKLVEE